MIPKIGLFDFLFWFFYFCNLLIFLLIYSKWKLKNNSQPFFFIFGLITKLIGGSAFALIYLYYYQGGDTFGYYKSANQLYDIFWESPRFYFEIIFESNTESLSHILSLAEINPSYSRASEEWTTVKLLSILNLFSFKNYLILTVLTSLVSFFGSWKLFHFFLSYFPDEKRKVFICCFLIPSVVFWGGGILKDTFTLFGLSIFVWAVDQILFKKKIRIISILYIVIGFGISFYTKAYVIIAFIPALLMGYYVFIKRNIQNKLLKVIAGPILIIAISIVGFTGIISLTENTKKYEFDALEERVKGFHSWHTHQGGSSYNLGDIEFTTWGIISKIPSALNVTFFRPYIWETSNIVVFFGALESAFFLYLMIKLLYIQGFRIRTKILSNHVFVISLVYCIVLGFSVGFTSYNFGALGRYKIPCLPFALLFLMMLSQKEKPKLPIDKKK